MHVCVLICTLFFYIVAMEPSNVECALLDNDTLVEIVPSAPASYNRSSTTYLSADYNSGRGFSTWFNSMFSKSDTQNSGPKTSSDSGYSSGSGGGVNSGHNGGADSGSNGGTTSGHSSEVTSPISATSTPSSISPTPWDPWYMMNWLLPQSAKTPVDMKGTTVDPLPIKGISTTFGASNAPIKGKHKKQTSWPIVGRLLPENIDTPSLNVILRVQPHSNDMRSSQSDVKQLDVFVHPSTLPALHMRRHGQEEESTAGYLVKLQTVLPPEKPAKKPKSEQDDESVSAPQPQPVNDKRMVKALVVRLCFSSYHFSSAQESSATLIEVKPGHILISDCVRQQMRISDFSHVRLTEVTNSMRVPCNGHSIKLTLLNNKVSIYL